MNIISYFLTKMYVEGTEMAFLENSSFSYQFLKNKVDQINP